MRPLRPLETPLAGLQLIEASAGTGKTFAITTLALRAVIEAQLDVSRILIVTFTNAATAELRRRLRGRLHRALATYADVDAARDDQELRALVARRAAQGHAEADRRRLRLALDGFDEAAIFTIHGFCQRVLREFAFESGAAFDAELIGDPRPLLADAVRDVWSARRYDASPEMLAGLDARGITLATVTRVARTFAMHRSLQVRVGAPAAAPPDAATDWARRFMREAGPAVLETLARRKRAANLQDFDDLLHQLADALAGPFADDLARGIGRRFGMALIDEFQDTDPVQYHIFREVNARAGKPLFLIGDPKQAIYAFRGADVFAYLAAQRAASSASTLLTNWRSAPLLVGAVNTLFTNAPTPFVFKPIEFREASVAERNANTLAGAGAGAPLRIAVARRADHGLGEREPFARGDLGRWFYRALADRLVELLDGRTTLDGRPLRPGDIAVLCRRNAQLFSVGDALRAAGIPSVALGDASVFEAPEAEMLERVLRALAEPGDAAALRAALVTPLVGLDSGAIARLNADESEWDLWAERFLYWSERWRASGFTAALRGLFDELRVPERVLAHPGGERCLTNLLHVGELLQQAASEGRRGPHGLVDWLHRLRVDQTLRQDLGGEAAQIRLESDAHAVSLITIHKSKGLEFPVVVCPFPWDTIDPKEDRAWPCFHDDDGRFTIDLGMPPAPDSLERRDREVAAEDVRLLYVALTRAKQLCVLVWGAFKFFERSALAELLHRWPRRNADEQTRRERKEMRALSDAEIGADLAALVAASKGAIGIEALPPPRDLRHAAPPPDGTALAPPPPAPTVARAWRIGSFTSLSAGGELLGAHAEEEGRDHDEVAADAEPGAGAAASLQGFPRGRGPGALVHRILEAVDFAAPAPVLREVVARELATARIGPEWVDPLTEAVRDVLATPLLAGPDPPRLRDVPRACRLSEMEFAYPVARAAGRQPVTAAALADVFARHGGTAELAAYAERMRRLPFRPLAGFLRGYIDCVFAHGGRWYVVDYKTNDLGSTAAHYAPAALAAEMARHDYVLQYHLYVVALHRYLQRRLPAYDYARDVGGALYLFLRGMAPTRGPATGVVHALPSPALIAALSTVLDG